jgi:hypothetical protein
MATAGTGHRGVLAAYPLVVVALAGPVALRRRGRHRMSEADRPEPLREGEAQSRRWHWGLAVVASLALIYVCVPYFQSTPVPGQDTPIGHYSDLDYHLSLAAEAKHRSPIQDPSVAGEPKPYHVFVYMHLAAASQITSLDLPLVFFRLYLAPLLVLAVLGLGLIGRTLARASIVGVVAAGLFVFVGEIDLDPGLHQGDASLIPFTGFSVYAFHSPSAIFGLALILPLLVALVERLDGDGRPAGASSPAPWLAVLLLIFACSDAKISILPTLIGGLVLFAGWRMWRDRELDRTALIALGMSAVTLAILYLVQYRGHSSPIRIDAFASLSASPVLVPVVDDLSGSLPGWDSVLDGLASLVTVAFLLAPLLAGVACLARRGVRWPRSRVFLLAVAVSGLLQALVLNDPTGPNLYYSLFYGLAALAPISAEGLRAGWVSHGPAVRAALPRLAPLAVAGLALVAAVTWILEGSSDLLSSEGRLFALRYGGLALAMAAIWLFARRASGRTAAAALVAGLLLVLGTFGGPSTTSAAPRIRPTTPTASARPWTEGRSPAWSGSGTTRAPTP